MNGPLQGYIEPCSPLARICPFKRKNNIRRAGRDLGFVIPTKEVMDL